MFGTGNSNIRNLSRGVWTRSEDSRKSTISLYPGSNMFFRPQILKIVLGAKIRIMFSIWTTLVLMCCKCWNFSQPISCAKKAWLGSKQLFIGVFGSNFGIYDTPTHKIEVNKKFSIKNYFCATEKWYISSFVSVIQMCAALF